MRFLYRLWRSRAIRKGLTILWFTDPHLSETYDEKPEEPGAQPDYRRFWAGSYRMGKIIAHANTLQPDLVLCTGDFADTGTDVSFFKPYWDQISVPNKELVVGNHDLFGSTYASLVTALEYDQRPENAGSVFNRAFTIETPVMDVLCITLDTTQDDDGVHASRSSGYLTPDTLTWLETQLDGITDERVVLVALHHPPLSVAPPEYFDEDDASAFQSLVDAARLEHPRTKILVLAGHWHGITDLRANSEKDEIVAPCVLDYVSGKYLVLTVYENGSHTLETFETGVPSS